MKKIITIILTFCFIFGAFSAPVAAKTEYVKVKKSTYQKYKKAYKQYDDLLELKELTEMELKEANSKNDWLWNNLSAMNIKYKNKTWTIKGGIPETFYVNGVEYTVNIERSN